jgi:hypothetical protein
MEQPASQRTDAPAGVRSEGIDAGTITRHYRGTTRAGVEQAYSDDAAQAAQAGYLPVTHQWTTDWEGLLLAVTYRQSSSGAHSMANAATVPESGTEQANAVAPSAAPVEHAQARHLD